MEAVKEACENNFNLAANIRKSTGSADSRRARKNGAIPAVILDKNGNLNVTIDAKTFEQEYFKGQIYTTLADISVDGKNIKAIAHKIEFDPVTDRPIHIDFIKVEPGQNVKVAAKVNFLNRDKCIGLKRGGFLHINLRRIAVICPVDAIVENINIDISKNIVGDKIRSNKISLPAGTKFAAKEEFLVASITGRGTKATEESSEEDAQEGADGEEAKS